MANKSCMYCFRASYDYTFDKSKVPSWLSVDENWQGYRITTLPWIVDVARVLNLLPIEDTLEDWVAYLENLGLEKIQPVCCEELFEDKLYC